MSYLHMPGHRPLHDRAVVETAIMHTLAYSDVFDYPLTVAEIHRYLVGVAASEQTIDEILVRGRLVPRCLAGEKAYFTLPGREAIVETRRRRETIARTLWPQALRYGRLLAQVPFMRMVAVTGSLAVNNAGPAADIDYLLVTANDRLWLSRAFSILVVRLAARRGIGLCPNYLLSERALRFKERNLYTAHELTQMIPVAGEAVYRRMRQVNRWTDDWLPNATHSPRSPDVPAPPTTAQATRPGQLAEWILSSRLGAAVEQWEMERKLAKFQQQLQEMIAKQQRADEAVAEAQFTADWCKGHFGGYTRRILDAYATRVRVLEADG